MKKKGGRVEREREERRKRRNVEGRGGEERR